MPAYIDMTVALRNDALDAAMALTDGGKLELRTGASPGSGAGASGTLLASFDLNTPAWGAAASGEIDIDPPTAVTATADGTVGHCRVYQSDDTTTAFDVKAGGSMPITAVNTGTEYLTTLVNHGYSDGDELEIFIEPGTSGALPSPLVVRTSYFAKNAATNQLQLEASVGGGAINLGAGFVSGIRFKKADVGVALSAHNGAVTAGTTVNIVSFTVRM